MRVSLREMFGLRVLAQCGGGGGDATSARLLLARCACMAAAGDAE